MIDNPEILLAYMRRCNAVTIDSREIYSLKQQGKRVMFIAIKGENFDGNDFVSAALEDGAEFVITDNIRYEESENRRVLVVQDSYKALHKLARAYRRYTEAKVIAITGTNGKTTTKELAAKVLSRKYKTYATEGNLNNHIGVPLTLLNMPQGTEVAIIEMGANHIGEIKALCTIAEPDYGVITNIGSAHLEGFGSHEGVIEAKGELYDYLRSTKGVIFYDASNPIITKMAKEREGARRTLYNSTDARATQNSDGELKVSFKGKTVEINTSLTGLYNSANIAAAFAIAKAFGIDYLTFVDGIESYIPRNNRSQLIYKERVTIISDAYNANPSSMAVAIDSLKNCAAKSRIVILGAMKELGEESSRLHSEVVNLVNCADIDAIYLIGEEYEGTFPADNDKFKYFTSVETFKFKFKVEDFGESTILIKGSRAMKLEEIISFF